MEYIKAHKPSIKRRRWREIEGFVEKEINSVLSALLVLSLLCLKKELYIEDHVGRASNKLVR